MYLFELGNSHSYLQVLPRALPNECCTELRLHQQQFYRMGSPNLSLEPDAEIIF